MVVPEVCGAIAYLCIHSIKKSTINIKNILRIRIFSRRKFIKILPTSVPRVLSIILHAFCSKSTNLDFYNFWNLKMSGVAKWVTFVTNPISIVLNLNFEDLLLRSKPTSSWKQTFNLARHLKQMFFKRIFYKVNKKLETPESDMLVYYATLKGKYAWMYILLLS